MDGNAALSWWTALLNNPSTCCLYWQKCPLVQRKIQIDLCHKHLNKLFIRAVFPQNSIFGPISQNPSNTPLIQSAILFQPQFPSTQQNPNSLKLPQAAFTLPLFNTSPKYLNSTTPSNTIQPHFPQKFPFSSFLPSDIFYTQKSLTLLKLPLTPEHILCIHLAQLVNFMEFSLTFFLHTPHRYLP